MRVSWAAERWGSTAPRSRSLVLAALVSWAGACEEGQASPSPAPEESKGPARAVHAASGSPKPAPPKPRSPLPGRLVAIGDVHGDLQATRGVLQLAGAVGADDHWVGGDLTVVQTGDQLDRGDDERAILDWFERLQLEAQRAGGRLVVLNGNHETMNVQGDYRYVTPTGLTQFSGVAAGSVLAARLPSRFRARGAAFLPGGHYARVLAKRDLIAVVGDSVFVHGGVLPEHVAYGIERINREAQSWMRGEARRLPAHVASERSPVWVRDYSLTSVAAAACQALGEVLRGLGAVRMVVGHTPQKTGITSACDDRVYRIDVGLARHYGDGPVQALEILGKNVRILTAAP